ncbi:unnamed protein product [Hymenolepis diminuta]|uniref:Uncharacterized protein n=1 Tax=Hymenolepis diminuta TaxID=6216 RepID=A0A564XZX0_HYMDI|nr:unnamed protein product [Hymenolepis diminuta]
MNNKKTISEEISTPPFRVSRINPASLRTFLPERASGLFLVLESHFKNNNIRSQINKFHVLIITIPPSLIAPFANVIQGLLQNPMMNLKLLSYNVSSYPQVNKMKLFAPEESFDTYFWKLLILKNSHRTFRLS